MNKKRIIPILFAMDAYLVRSENFTWHQKLGNLITQVQRYSEWNLDELIYIDIGLTRNPEQGLTKDPYEYLNSVSQKCRMPLTFGGGVKSVEDASRIFKNGADKIVLSTAAVHDNGLIKKLAYAFGSQAICISLDIKLIEGSYFLTSRAGSDIHHELDIIDHIKRCEQMGCGEFLIHAIHEDGKGQGFDTKLLEILMPDIQVPSILCGGAGSAKHFRDVLENYDVSAIAAGNFFNFKELSYPMLKSTLYRNYPSLIRKP